MKSKTKIRTSVRAGSRISESEVMNNPLYVGNDTGGVNPLFGN